MGKRSLLERKGGNHMEGEKQRKPSEGRGEGGAMRDDGCMRTLSMAKETPVGGYPQGLVNEAYTHRLCSEMNQLDKKGPGELLLY